MPLLKLRFLNRELLRSRCLHSSSLKRIPPRSRRQRLRLRHRRPRRKLLRRVRLRLQRRPQRRRRLRQLRPRQRRKLCRRPSSSRRRPHPSHRPELRQLLRRRRRLRERRRLHRLLPRLQSRQPCRWPTGSCPWDWVTTSSPDPNWRRWIPALEFVPGPRCTSFLKSPRAHRSRTTRTRWMAKSAS